MAVKFAAVSLLKRLHGGRFISEPPCGGGGYPRSCSADSRNRRLDPEAAKK
jgi:hypothetical protein